MKLNGMANRKLWEGLILLYLLPMIIGGMSALSASAGDLAPSDLLINKEGTTLYVLEQGARQIRRVELNNGYRSEVLALPVTPERMTWFPDRKTIAIVGGQEKGALCLISLADKQVNSDNQDKTVPSANAQTSDRSSSGIMTLTKTIPLGHTPHDVAVGPDKSGKNRVYAANRFTGDIQVIDPESGKVLHRWPAGREPYSIKITPNGRHLVVANLLPEHQSDVFYIMAKVRIFDTETGKSTAIDLLNGVTGLKDIALSADGKYAFVTGNIGKFQTVTSQVVGGWIVENVISVIDIERQEAVETLYLDDALLGAGNPWGICCDSEGEFLVVSISGTDEIFFMPFERINRILADRPEGNRPGGGAYTYTYQGLGKIQFPFRLRVKMGLKGMRRILIHHNTVYVAAYFEDAIGVVTLRKNPPYENHPGSYVRMGKAPKTVNLEKELDDPNTIYPRYVTLEPSSPLKGIELSRGRIQLAPKPAWSTVRRGEVLFHDATICMENWLSCATCHPDARIDGLNWDLVNDGVGNAKNSKSMLLSHETPPSMISGVREDAETAVRAGVTHLLFNEIPEEDYAAMDEYLKALKPVPSPHLIDGKMSPSAQRGRFIFESPRSQCSTCHFAPLFTDLRLHKVHSQDYYDTVSKFDTPTLIEVWRTAPYLNTGHYRTIRELLLEGKHGNSDGLLEKLSSQELEDLIEYVLSL